MKKKKIQKTNAIRLVEQKKIHYTEYEFPWSEDHIDARAVADSMGVNRGRIFKTLLTKGSQTGVVVAVLPGDQELDLKKLAKESGNKKIEMLPLKELEATTGYIRGGCSPIGMKKLFPTFLDCSATEFKEIIVSAGKRGLQMELSPADLLALTSGKLTDLVVAGNIESPNY